MSVTELLRGLFFYYLLCHAKLISSLHLNQSFRNSLGWYKKLNISFFTKSDWVSEHITEKKTEAGYLKVSSPELTAFDLIKYHKRIGGLNRILPILDELAETVKTIPLANIAKTQKTPDVQRLGFLLDELGNEVLANSHFKLIRYKLQEVPISLMHKNRTGPLNNRWKIIDGCVYVAFMEEVLSPR